MYDHQLRMEMYVTISKDIELTKANLGFDNTMIRMAGDGKPRRINQIRNSDISRAGSKKVVEIAGYNWLPHDLELWEPESPSDIKMKGGKFNFDPSEL